MKVSIIIPSRNDRGFLHEAIESAKAQTYKDTEIIVIEGERSVSENINIGFEQSTGEIINYFADDDLLTPHAAATVVDRIGDFDFIHANAIRFTPTSRSTYKPTNTNPTLKELAKHNHIHGGTCWYKRECFEAHPFDQTLWTGEEYEMHLRMLASGMKLGYINETLFQYRLHPKQKSIGNRNKEYQAKRQVAITKIKEKYLSLGN